MKRLSVLVAIGAVAVVGLAACGSDSGLHHRAFTVIVKDAEATVSPSDFFTAKPKLDAQGSEDAPVYQSGKKTGLAETVYTVTRMAGDDVMAMIECHVQ